MSGTQLARVNKENISPQKTKTKNPGLLTIEVCKPGLTLISRDYTKKEIVDAD